VRIRKPPEAPRGRQLFEDGRGAGCVDPRRDLLTRARLQHRPATSGTDVDELLDAEQQRADREILGRQARGVDVVILAPASNRRDENGTSTIVERSIGRPCRVERGGRGRLQHVLDPRQVPCGRRRCPRPRGHQLAPRSRDLGHPHRFGRGRLPASARRQRWHSRHAGDRDA